MKTKDQKKYQKCYYWVIGLLVIFFFPFSVSCKLFTINIVAQKSKISLNFFFLTRMNLSNFSIVLKEIFVRKWQ